MKLLKASEDDYTTYPTTLDNYRWYKPALIMILSVILFFAFMVVFMTILMLVFPDFNILAGNPLDYTSYTSIMMLFAIALLIPSIYMATKLVYKIPFSKQIAVNRKWNWGILIKTMIVSFIVIAIFMVGNILLKDIIIINHFTLITFLLILIVVPLQCFAEEYLFRGLLMQSLGSWFKIPLLAIVLQAVIFGIIHNQYDMMGMGAILFSGLVYGFLTSYTKGLEVSTAIHTANNIIGIILPGIISTYSSQSSIENSLLHVITLVVLILIIFLIEKKFGWFGFDN